MSGVVYKLAPGYYRGEEPQCLSRECLVDPLAHWKWHREKVRQILWRLFHMNRMFHYSHAYSQVGGNKTNRDKYANTVYVCGAHKSWPSVDTQCWSVQGRAHQAGLWPVASHKAFTLPLFSGEKGGLKWNVKVERAHFPLYPPWAYLSGARWGEKEVQLGLCASVSVALPFQSPHCEKAGCYLQKNYNPGPVHPYYTKEKRKKLWKMTCVGFVHLTRAMLDRMFI